MALITARSESHEFGAVDFLPEVTPKHIENEGDFSAPAWPCSAKSDDEDTDKEDEGVEEEKVLSHLSRHLGALEITLAPSASANSLVLSPSSSSSSPSSPASLSSPSSPCSSSSSSSGVRQLGGSRLNAHAAYFVPKGLSLSAAALDAGTKAGEEDKEEYEGDEGDAEDEGCYEGDVEGDDLPMELEAKHPLQFRWTMWYNAPAKQGNAEWTDNVQKILSFDTVEDFWCLYNNLIPASKLLPGCNYHLFKEDIKPEWEDEANRSGGKWIMVLPRKQAYARQMDECWLWTLLALIGEFFGDSDDICGVVISPRAKQNKLALWTRTGTDVDMCLRLGMAFKANIGYGQPIGYQIHSDCMRHGYSFRNANRYVV